MTDISVAPSRAFSPALVVAICFCIAALEGYDIQAVGVAAPSMAPALHMSEGQIGLAGSLSMVGLVLGAIIGGWTADRVGRKPVLVGSVAWFGAFSVVTALAQSPDMLLASRLLTGIGFGGALPNMIAIASEISRPERRTATVMTIFVGMPAGGALSAIIAGSLPHGFDWRLIYVVGGVLPLVLAPVTYFLLPETRPDHAPGADLRALPALFGGGRAATTLLLWIAFAFTLVVLYLMLGWLPLLVVAKGLGKQAGSMAALSFNLVSIVGGIGLGMVIDRAGFRWPLAFTYIGLVGSMALLATATGLVAVIALSGLVGCFVVGAQYALYGLAPRFYAIPVRGAGAGAAVGAGRLGSIAGPMLAGTLREHHASAGQVLNFTLPVIFIAGVAAVLLTFVGKMRED
jgi:AAHS family 3-hydroxyphenylpropionic acid transporter